MFIRFDSGVQFKGKGDHSTFCPRVEGFSRKLSQEVRDFHFKVI